MSPAKSVKNCRAARAGKLSALSSISDKKCLCYPFIFCLTSHFACDRIVKSGQIYPLSGRKRRAPEKAPEKSVKSPSGFPAAEKHGRNYEQTEYHYAEQGAGHRGGAVQRCGTPHQRQPFRALPRGYGGILSEDVPCPILRQMRALPHRAGDAGKTSGRCSGRQRDAGHHRTHPEDGGGHLLFRRLRRAWS